MNEAELIYRALDRLEVQTGMQGKWKPGHQDIDGELDLYFTGNSLHTFVEIKKELRQYQLPQILEMAARYQPFMVVADRIFPTLKEALREHKIGYLDTAGNIFFRTNNNYIWIDGNKLQEEEKPVTNRAFTKTGLKTVFYLLLHADAINLPYRTLAQTTGVALGNINNIINGLKEAGFILQVDAKTLQLQNKKALLERWIAGYQETLKPALHVGNFRFFNKDKLDNWHNNETTPDIVWGGEAAADIFTNYLYPQILTVYTQEKKAHLMTNWTLIPDEKGKLQVYDKFWKDAEWDNQKIAPPLLVYADLIITNDPRCIETAGMIYDKYLKNDFEQR